MLLKSDGASLYTTTDLATIVERMKLFNPDEILYVVDKRQNFTSHPGIPLRKKDRPCKRWYKAFFPQIRNHERKRQQTVQDKRGGVMRLETHQISTKRCLTRSLRTVA